MIEHIIELYLPLILSNVLHMIVVKFDLFAPLAVPLNEKLFGANKTYRGFIFVSITSGIFYTIFSNHLSGIEAMIIGFVLGFTYMLCELPNSWFKRKMGIKSGQRSSKHPWLFTILDKSDSALGVCLVYALIYHVELSLFLGLFFFAFLTHLTLSQLLVLTRVKRSL